MRKLYLLPAAIGLLLTGCATIPTGPNVMVLPGTGKDFDEFRADDSVCRQWAGEQIGATNPTASGQSDAVTGAVVGTVLGAATGAAIGAAAGNPAAGAAIGAGVGALGGTAVGADSGGRAEGTLQHRYDSAYMQCMYAKGNQIPLPSGTQLTHASPPQPPPPPASVPRPPSGRPPPPPPGY